MVGSFINTESKLCCCLLSMLSVFTSLKNLSLPVFTSEVNGTLILHRLSLKLKPCHASHNHAACTPKKWRNCGFPSPAVMIHTRWPFNSFRPQRTWLKWMTHYQGWWGADYLNQRIHFHDCFVVSKTESSREKKKTETVSKKRWFSLIFTVKPKGF